MASILCGDAEFPLTAFGMQHEQSLLTEYAVCVKREKKLFKTLLTASSKSDFRKAVRQYLLSPSCRFVAMLGQARRLPKWKRLPISVYRDLAKNLSLFEPISEPVEYWYEPKASGKGFRLLHAFGPMHRAAQYMVMRVLSVRLKPKGFQYGVPQRGHSEAISFIKGKIAAGHKNVLTLDARNYFNSFSRDGLIKLLPLPKSVIANVVVPENLHLKPKKGEKLKKQSINGCASSNTYNTPSQTVLPQGSLCSNIVAAYVVSLLDIALPSGVACVMYVDDICLLADNSDELEAARHALLLAFEKSAAGDFTFEISEETLAGGVRFLGYLLWLVPGVGKLLVRPSDRNLEAHQHERQRREKKLADLHKKKPTTEKMLRALADYYEYRLSWAMAFRAADNFPSLLLAAHERFGNLCLKYKLPLSSAKQYAGATFEHQTVVFSKKSGGYVEKIKLANPAKALASVPNVDDPQ